jgi:hypothetical protein
MVGTTPTFQSNLDIVALLRNRRPTIALEKLEQRRLGCHERSFLEWRTLGWVGGDHDQEQELPL